MSVGAVGTEAVLETIVDVPAIGRDDSAKDEQIALGADRASSVWVALPTIGALLVRFQPTTNRSVEFH